MAGSEQGRSRRFFDLSHDPCVELDLEGRFIAANPVFCRVAGREAGALQGAPVLDIVHPDDRAVAAEALARGAIEDAVRFEARIVGADGEVRWLSWGGVFSRADRIIRFVLHDVTELRRAEAAARERERFLSTLLANLPGMVYRCANDPKWTMAFVSGCEPLTGYPVEDMLDNRRVYFTDLMHPDDAGRVWDEVQAALAKRGPYILKFRIRTAAGEEKWVREQGRGVYSAEGELLALEGFIIDITERVRAEEALLEQLRLVEAQAAEIRDLSLPILEVGDDVLALPIIGTVDEVRAARILEGLLEAVVRTQSSHVILDLTAVRAIDENVAEHLVRILRAVSLLGARGVLAGITPTVARTMVALSVDMSQIPTLPDLRDALAFCLGTRPARGLKAAR
jgi:PAS domain S-box-containing protein